jgi:threonine dehydratase
VISLSDVYTAAERIRGHVRRTPMMHVPSSTHTGSLPSELYLKLEFLQLTGSFKPRGAFNRALSEPVKDVRGLVTSSGGNHGIALAYVGQKLGLPVTIPLFSAVSAEKLEKMRALGADAEIVGPSFEISNARAKEIAAERGYLYVHPFADPGGVAGQGTIGLEVLADLPDVDIVVVAVGGGGLLGGLALAIKEQRPATQIIGVEPVGADALTRSMAAGHLVRLEGITTKVTTLAPPSSEQLNLDLAHRYVDRMVTVTDDEMLRAAQWLWRELAIPTELAGAAAIAALFGGQVHLLPGQRVVSIVCGAGSAGMS